MRARPDLPFGPAIAGAQGALVRRSGDPTPSSSVIHCVAMAAFLLAQVPGTEARAQRVDSGDPGHLAVNALVGGLTSAVTAYARGGNPRTAFTRGALGGLGWYGGKFLAAADFEGAGFMGRQISAVGSSIVRNAGEGRSSFATVALPLGPLRVDVTRLEPGQVRAQIHLWDLVAMIYGLAGDFRFAAGESLSAGAPVFVADGRTLRTRGLDANGFATGGVIFRSGLIINATTEAVLAHERVHVLQHDFTSHAWSDPLEDFVVAGVFGPNRLSKYLVGGVAQPLVSGLMLTISDPSPLTRWFEAEADLLSGN